MEKADEKLSVLLGIKFTETMANDLRRAAGGQRRRPALIRRYCAEGLTRHREKARDCKLSRCEARAIAEARALDIDPVAALRAAIAAKISNP